MAWKGVHLASSARLACKQRQLVVTQDSGTVTVPLEDLAYIILDSPQVTLTTALLSACCAQGIMVLVPDDRHHPAGMLLPFHAHHLQAHMAFVQRDASDALKKRLWKAMVQQKIRNQAAVLSRPDEAKALHAMAAQVKSGDPDNTEARAARYYWPKLFRQFTRDNEADRRNALLNYGYAVVRGALARAVVATGLLPAFGVFHASKSNSFNLVDDLLEPFRPLIDTLVCEHSPGHDENRLTLADRQTMATILNRNVLVGHETVTVLVATEKAAVSLATCLEQGSPALLQLPVLTRRGLP